LKEPSAPVRIYLQEQAEATALANISPSGPFRILGLRRAGFLDWPALFRNRGERIANVGA
jgi:hypothetical protein